MGDINQEITHLVSKMREIGDLPYPDKYGNHNNLLRYRVLQDQILEKFISAFEAGYRLSTPALISPNVAVTQSPYPDGDQSILACPRCGSGEYLYNEDGNEQNYCGQCGQRIDWSRLPEEAPDGT